MATVLTSLGVEFHIGTRTGDKVEPSSWMPIPQVIEMTEIDLDPDTIETTSFENKRYKSSVSGLIDTTGIQSLTVNATDDAAAEEVWDEFADQPAWLRITIPGRQNDMTYIPILPIKTGAYNVTVNDRITIRLKYTIADDLVFGSSLTDAN